MGLAGPRNRRKIQHDPNNTKWSRDETTFGQKILRAQGWEPGKFLGAQNASHSHLHSAASAAPINVLMKDDTLGLGAKPKHKQNAECTGLDVFKDLLGRLNGKSEETIKKEQEVRSGIKTNLYVERKYGLMRFVSGGLLVGDQMKELISTTVKTTEEKADEKPAIKLEETTTIPAKKQKKDKKSKKRKAEDLEPIDSSDAAPEKKRKKRSRENGLVDDSAEPQEAEKSNKKSKKSKKSKRRDDEETKFAEPERKKKSKKSKKGPEDETESNDISTALEDAQAEKPLSKEERRARKKEKKAKKQKQLETPDSSTEATSPAETSNPITLATPQESGTSTPVGAGTSTPQGLSARHYARSRHIASKRMAMSDMAALNQIFMVKPV
ncbi:hypothetical protein F5Y02DRAFT_405106 [Annulohypoxylon stygium]|nr:hypothetical protein F5Y02DRAFT_405106 [Annulohypoxylon stygium]